MKRFCQETSDVNEDEADMANWENQSYGWQKRGWTERRGRGDFGGFERDGVEAGHDTEVDAGPSGERGRPLLRKPAEAIQEAPTNSLEEMRAEVAAIRDNEERSS